jgi:hypothetical protein
VAVKVEVDVIKPGTPSAADQRRRKVIYFAIANLVALGIAVAIFALLAWIPEGHGFDGAMGAVSRFLGSHMGLAALAASTPFFASLLVGQYEMRRARARRARKEAEERRQRIEEELAVEEAARAARRAVKH